MNFFPEPSSKKERSAQNKDESAHDNASQFSSRQAQTWRGKTRAGTRRIERGADIERLVPPVF
jgi:hypothetical protein